MTFVALDDEPIALAIIERYAREVPGLQLLASFTDAAAAADFLRENTVDLLLTDINMPDVSGLQFVRELPDEHPMVIFVTAYKEHAHEGFDLDVVDYLVKPVSPERFKRAIQKATELIELRQKAESAGNAIPTEDHFFVFSEYQQVKITIQDIRYIEGMGDYVKIFLADQSKPVLTLERMKVLTDRLHPHGFRRIHRSFLVNLGKVAAMQKSKIKIGQDWLPIGETYVEVLKEIGKMGD
ncbi:MAG TPA: LytTR family DNA-binding domain-containing protein [Saprospiraceae bacterium]|nr:LytTR family DNA-binding domain-containing protein [Saprospiraceae bacterium]HMQ81590.1 LytTR family DNA-binding domain-containing protein [Saprospiraceae bacterium]